jgi:hypothetical protein
VSKVDRITKSVAASSSIFPQKYYDEKLEKNYAVCTGKTD